MSWKEVVLEYGMTTSNALSTLAEYRQAIAKAQTSQDLELLIYRALPALYADMGMAYSTDDRVSVATKIYRSENTWRLWFNISIPKAIEALGHLAPDIFHSMSGGLNQASSITKNAYGQGFSKETQPFVVERAFVEQQERLVSLLNKATSFGAWWANFYEELPWALARTRGWETPDTKQWALAQANAAEFWQVHGERLKSYFLLDGSLRDGLPQVRTRWASASANFTDRIDRKFYPLLNHFPGMDLDASAVHSFNIKKINIEHLGASLCARGKETVLAYCSISDTRVMPAYLLVDAMQCEPHFETTTALPEGAEMGTHAPF